MSKYNISPQLKAIENIKLPLNRVVIFLAQRLMKPPKNFFDDDEIEVQKHKIPGFKNDLIEAFVISPKNVKKNAPCLMFYHGGGFVLEASFHHYHFAKTYAKELGAKVIFVRYRLAPKFNFPYPTEDCYASLLWAIENAKSLGIDKHNIGVGGDSAGGNLSAGVCLLARDRKLKVKLKFQKLVYPFLDYTLSSKSNQKYTDTPIWNSTNSQKIKKLVEPNSDKSVIQYASPLHAENFENLPPAYIETAEFDSLHDDGINYAKKLKQAGNVVELNQTKGTVHGYDMVLSAPIVQEAVKKRVDFMKKYFET